MQKEERATSSKPRTYVIGEATFRNKEDLEKYLQHILYSYQSGEVLNSQHTRFLLALLHNHPKAEEKFGCGIQAFVVRQNPRFTTKRFFYLVRLDGTEDDFSFKKCLYPPSPLMLFKAVCQRLTGKRMYWIKAEHFRKHANAEGKVQCPITGQWIAREQAHVDHAVPIHLSVS
ncbi:DCL family protein [Ktedonobacter robiniae]|uniref:HNH endonuclease n=1 Tax=Ktedonobacter robiniae TaxID=2778365 RepID=A0ABQ3V0M5_9CHLR|nr:DCL family protein [Ktedonobacter robiniae]GHO58337.1 hypothetical protein KSB_68120 [Ktedonobacter robiniae]